MRDLTRAQVVSVSDKGFVVDDASRHDLPQILAIYNEVIRNSTAVYSEDEFTPARGDAWFDTKTAQGFPLIVARCVVYHEPLVTHGCHLRMGRVGRQRAVDAVTSSGSSAVRVQLPSFCRWSS